MRFHKFFTTPRCLRKLMSGLKPKSETNDDDERGNARSDNGASGP